MLGIGHKVARNPERQAAKCGPPGLGRLPLLGGSPDSDLQKPQTNWKPTGLPQAAMELEWACLAMFPVTASEEARPVRHTAKTCLQGLPQSSGLRLWCSFHFFIPRSLCPFYLGLPAPTGSKQGCAQSCYLH